MAGKRCSSKTSSSHHLRTLHHRQVVPQRAITRPAVSSPLLIVRDLTPEGKKNGAHNLQQDVVRSLDGWASTELCQLLNDPVENWQPQDFLPDPSSDSFIDEVIQLRMRTQEIPDDTLITLVEEALPTYMSMLNRYEGIGDETGTDETGWGIWNRMWTAEENRHGDLLNKYLWLSGRIDSKMVERTIQNLIGSGMDPKTENSPFLGFIYTSFQERATKISHGNTGYQARRAGDNLLAKICGTIAADEGRHEVAYKMVVSKFFEASPSHAMICWKDMLKKQIAMPAHAMTDGGVHMKREGRLLFEDFASVAEATNTYTALDYATIIEHLNNRWRIADIHGLNGHAAEAQEYVLKMPNRVRRLAERRDVLKQRAGKTSAKFSWIFNRQVSF